MRWWLWFALDSERRLSNGRHAGDEVAIVHAVLRERGLEPLLVVPRDRWEQELAGGPPGEPRPILSAAELAMLRADGVLELPARHADTRRPERVPRHHRPERATARHHWRRGRTHDAPGPDPLAELCVHARPFSQSLVSVAMCLRGGEVLEGTERLFGTDDAGLAAAAEWKGQLEYVLEGWRSDPPEDPDDPEADPLPAPDADVETDAQAAARLLDS